VALKHAMLIALWYMLRDGEFHNEPGGDFYTRRDPDKAKNRAIDQLKKLGYDVTVTAQPAAG
jgi:transposase